MGNYFIYAKNFEKNYLMIIQLTEVIKFKILGLMQKTDDSREIYMNKYFKNNQVIGMANIKVSYQCRKLKYP